VQLKTYTWWATYVYKTCMCNHKWVTCHLNLHAQHGVSPHFLNILKNKTKMVAKPFCKVWSLDNQMLFHDHFPSLNIFFYLWVGNVSNIWHDMFTTTYKLLWVQIFTMKFQKCQSLGETYITSTLLQNNARFLTNLVSTFKLLNW